MNDSIGEYVASQVVKMMIKKGIAIKGANLLMLGISFKENCPDVRNKKSLMLLLDYLILILLFLCTSHG